MGLPWMAVWLGLLAWLGVASAGSPHVDDAPTLQAQFHAGGTLRSIDLDASGARLVTATGDGQVIIWHAESGRAVRQVVPDWKGRGRVDRVTFAGGGRWLLVEGGQDEVLVVHTASGRVVARFGTVVESDRSAEHTSDARTVDVVRDSLSSSLWGVTAATMGGAHGDRLALATSKNTIVSFRLGQTGAPTSHTPWSRGRITALAISPVSDQVAALNDESGLCVTDPSARDGTRCWLDLNGASTLAWHDADTIWVAQGKEVVAVHPADRSRTVVARLPDRVRSMDILPDGRGVVQLVSGAVWWLAPTPGGAAVVSSTGLAPTSAPVVVAPSGLVAWSTTPDGRLGTLGMLDGSVQSTVPPGVASIRQMRWSRGGLRLALLMAHDTVHVWDFEAGGHTTLDTAGGSATDSIELSANGRRLAVVREDGSVDVLPVGMSGAAVALPAADHPKRARVAFGPHDNLLARCTQLGHLELWDVRQGTLLHDKVFGPARWLRTDPRACRMTWSDDGDEVYVSSGRGIIRVPIAPDTAESLIRVAAPSPGRRTATPVVLDGAIGLAWHSGQTDPIDPTTHRTGTRQGQRVLEVRGDKQLHIEPSDGVVYVARTDAPEQPYGAVAPAGDLAGVGLSGDGRYFAFALPNGVVSLWTWAPDGPMVERVRIAHDIEGGFVAYDPLGRFDSSKRGHTEALHWLHHGTVTPVDRLAERFYQPGLVQRAIHGLPLRPVVGFTGESPPPEVSLQLDDARGVLVLDVDDAGGGIGEVRVTIGGREVSGLVEVSEDATGKARYRLDLAGHASIAPGAENRIEVSASNAAGWWEGAGVGVAYTAPEATDPDPREFHAVVVGISEYASPGYRLAWASKDARELGRAVELAATELFTAEHTHVRVLASDATVPEDRPSRENIVRAVEALAETDARDTVFLFFAGHGDTSSDGRFWFLTENAVEQTLTDSELRARTAVSTDDLRAWLRSIGASQRAVVLDTCKSGTAAEQLTMARDPAADRVRAMDRTGDRSGTWILAATAPDREAYEAVGYQQGLLTHALLDGLRGEALVEDRYVDVGEWYRHAEGRVPVLARGVDRQQQPMMEIYADSSTFYLGSLPPSVRRALPAPSTRSVVAQSAFLDATTGVDEQGLTAAVDRALEAAEGEGVLDFNGAPSHGGAWWVSGLTRVVDTGLQVELKVGYDATVHHAVVLESAGGVDDLAELVLAELQGVLDRQ